MASSMSNTILAWSPRKARPITSLTCSSRQARRQRVHWMQASRLTAMAGWDRSWRTCLRASKRGLPTPILAAHWSTSLLRVYSFSGMSDSSNSSTSFWEATARSLSVTTFMPATGARQHDGARTRSPLISTMQERQLPTASMPSLKQRWGISTPSRLATCSSESVARPWTSRPLRLKLTSGASSSASSCRVIAFIVVPFILLPGRVQAASS